MSSGLVGSRLGKYEIVSEIGHGGMSVVYRAKDTQLEREVAVKVMHTFLAEQLEAKERFHREAVAVARLKHPCIIEIFDYSGETAAESYIVTELVDGCSLAEYLRARHMTAPEAALVLARPIADALAHAHSNGVIHRDLKPENILVSKSGDIKLTDFGIARMLDNQTLTVTGTLLGSPAYMAPEYIDGETTDARADIFSFGAMLYQFAVGHLPFESHSAHGLLKKIANCDYTPPQLANPAIHAAVDRIIRRCLERRPSERYADAQELLAAIDQVLKRITLDSDAERLQLLANLGAYNHSLEKRLVPIYVDLGKAALKARAIGRASEDFDRVLSLEAGHAEVQRLVRRMGRRRLAGRVARDAAIIVAAVTALTFGVGTYLEQPSTLPKDERPVSRSTSPPPLPTVATVATATPKGAQRNVVFSVHGHGDLYIDGQLVQRGLSGGYAKLLNAGTYQVRVVGSERTTTAELLVPASGPLLPLELDVSAPQAPPKTPVRAPPVAQKRKAVRIRPSGVWINVYVDGVLAEKERMEPFDLMLPYGTHELRFTNPLALSETLNIKVSDTDPPELEPVRLTPLPAQLFIEGAPDGAAVEVAGKRVLLTAGEPVRVPLQTSRPTEHEVVVKHGDRVLLRQRAVFEPGKEQRLAVRSNPL